MCLIEKPEGLAPQISVTTVPKEVWDEVRDGREKGKRVMLRPWELP